MAKDYYEILGVPKNATLDEIKRAYRQLVMKYHPDVNKSKEAEEKMREINEAYAVLSDPEKRRRYDMLGSEQFSQEYSPEDIFRGFDIESIFKDLGLNFDFDFDLFPGFGRGDFSGEQPRGSDILYKLNLTFEEAAKGTEKEITIRHVKKCPHCNGTGVEPGYGYITCDKCGGTGRLVSFRNTFFGRLQTVTVCDKCGGSGKIPEKKCNVCRGKGGVVGEDKIKVEIPPGVMDGMRLRLSGMGDYANGRSGDLYLEIHVGKSKVFERSGDDLLVTVTIPFYTAALGGEIEVPTLDGAKRIVIPPGTQPGTKIRIPNAGIRHFKSSGSGDEIVTLNIEIPKSLTPNERKLLEDFKNLREKKRPFF
ncbi:MAG: molecular chaperone DnaJ [Candidatus Micrarchaeia archaeon]